MPRFFRLPSACTCGDRRWRRQNTWRFDDGIAGKPWSSAGIEFSWSVRVACFAIYIYMFNWQLIIGWKISMACRFLVDNVFVSKGRDRVLSFEIYSYFLDLDNLDLMRLWPKMKFKTSVSIVSRIMPPVLAGKNMFFLQFLLIVNINPIFIQGNQLVDSFRIDHGDWRWKMACLRLNSSSRAPCSTFMTCGKGQMRSAQMLLQDDTCLLKVPPHSFGHFCACQRLIAEPLGTFGISTSKSLGSWMSSRSWMETWQMKRSWILEKIGWQWQVSP